MATHIRLGAPRPRPRTRTTTTCAVEVRAFLADKAAEALAAGIPHERIMVDDGLDLGKTEPQSLELLRTSDGCCALGFATFLSASNKRFLGELVGTDVTDRHDATLAAHAARDRARAAASSARTTSPASRPGRRHAGGRPRGAGRIGGGGVSAPVILLKGSDPVLVGDVASSTVVELLGDRDRTECVDELSGDDYELGEAVMAANSVSMFGDRIVVARNAGNFSAADARRGDHLPRGPEPRPRRWCWCGRRPVASARRTTRCPRSCPTPSRRRVASVRDADAPGQAKQRQSWLDDRLAGAAVKFEPRAKQLDRRAGSARTSTA